MPDDACLTVSLAATGEARLSNGSTLTRRELDVLSLIATGRSNREIAGMLYLSVHTVEYYATRIYQKLGVANRTEAAFVANRLGLAGSVDQQSRESPDPNPGKAEIPGTSKEDTLSATFVSRSFRQMRIAPGWLLRHASSLRAGLIGAVLVVVFSATAVAAGRLDADEQLLGFRLDKRLFGHPPEYHCINPTPQPERYPWTTTPRPTPVLVDVPVHGTDDSVTGTPGDQCFRTEAEMWAHFGRDPERPRCVQTEPRPQRVEDVVFIPVGEPAPVSGVFCFGEFDELVEHFGFPSQP